VLGASSSSNVEKSIDDVPPLASNGASRSWCPCRWSRGLSKSAKSVKSFVVVFYACSTVSGLLGKTDVAFGR
jgi:hypothetical protein